MLEESFLYFYDKIREETNGGELMGELKKISGIGDILEQKFHTGGIKSMRDLLNWVPTRYDIHTISSFDKAALNEDITLLVKVVHKPTVAYIRQHLTKMTVEVSAGERIFKVSIFNREFLRNALPENTEIVIFGRFEANFNHFTAIDLQLKKTYQEGIIPIYRFPLISDRMFNKFAQKALDFIGKDLVDEIPEYLREKNHLPDLFEFYRIMHHPQTETEIFEASQRIKYEELLHFAVRIGFLKRENDSVFVSPKKYDIELVRRFISSLPFELTEDQKAVTNEIFRDLKKNRQMNRLLQGDVGSGKTIVSVIAALAVISGKEQVALMAPTEILAYQNYLSFRKYLEPFGVRTAFLSASVKGKERQEILDRLVQGTIDLVVGTHSLIQETILFRHLGFAIIDEQHRFGVNQRKLLRSKGLIPDMLFLSATPIPRTLAISIFGDMDVSSIHSLPEGRKKVMTDVLDFSKYEEVIHKVEKELEQGRQAYFIVPLIEQSDTKAYKDVSAVLKDLTKELPSSYKISALHGKMASEDKQQILSDFAQGKIHVLVSTTVVEVGVNVPNATEMVILNCEQFGLSQLHQLRGRVGRSEHQAYCHLLTDTILLGNSRFDILEKTTDGFEIAEEDLRQRGPGEVFGEEQTGIPKFRMANLITDSELLKIAFADAEWLFQSKDPSIKKWIQTTIYGIKETNLD